MELTAEQLMVVAIVALAIVQVIKIAMGLFGIPKPALVWLQVGTFVVSAVLAYFWQSPVTLPVPAADPWGFATALLLAALEIAALASLIYIALLEAILKGLDTLFFRGRRALLAPRR